MSEAETQTSSAPDQAVLGSARPPESAPDRLRPALREFFRHRSAQVLCSLFVIALLARLGVALTQPGAALGMQDLLVVAALLAIWPLNEWLIHRLMLHYKPVKLFGRTRDFLLPQTHRAHHRDPWNIDLVFIPGHVFPLTVPPAVIAVLILMPLPLALTLLTAFFLLSAHYEWTHYLAHIRYCPDLGFYRRRVREHRQHHFLNEQQWWGVSMGLADRVIGTAPVREQVVRSPTVRTLGMPQPPTSCYEAMRTAPPA